MLKKGEAMDVDTYVPGHGFVDPPEILREELTEYRKAMEFGVAEGRRLHGRGLSVEEALEWADWGEYASWTLSERNAPIVLRRIYDELEGKLPGGR